MPWSRSGSRSTRHAVRVGRFTFDERTLELLDRGRHLPLQPKPTLVLAELIAARGALVERERLYEVGWSDTVVEFDLALNRCVRDIRAAVGDDAREPWFVATVPRRGYRLIPQVEVPRPAACTWPVRYAAIAVLAAAALLLPASAPSDRRDPPREDRATILSFQSFGVGVAGIDEAIRDQVQRQLRLDTQRPHSTGLLVNGVIVPAPDGAVLEVTLVRLSDGEPIWNGRYNPLCDRIQGDANRLIARLISREVIQRS